MLRGVNSWIFLHYHTDLILQYTVVTNCIGNGFVPVKHPTECTILSYPLKDFIVLQKEEGRGGKQISGVKDYALIITS